MMRMVSGRFKLLGLTFGSWPKVTFAISLLIGLGMHGIVVMAEWESSIEYTYVPRASDAFREFEEMADIFGQRARSSEALLRAKDGGSMLRPEYLQSAWRIYGSIFYAESADGTQLVDVCERHPVTTNCTAASIFAFLPEADFPEAAGSFTQLGGAPSFQAAESLIAALESFGTPGLGFVLSKDHTALRFWFGLKPGDVQDRSLFSEKSIDEVRAIEWETDYQNFIIEQRDIDPLIEVLGISGSSVDTEISRNVTSATPFMGAAVNTILIFMAVMLGGRPCLRSRLALALGAVGLVMLAEGMGFALSIACGVPLTDVSLLVIFLAVGVGVDDILVLTDAFDAADPALPAQERLGEAFARGGTAILLTSLTNLVAFLVASTSDLPAIAWFCATAGWVVFCLLLVTVTMYAPLLVLDDRRRAAGRFDFFCCCSSSSGPVVPLGKDGKSPLGVRVRSVLKKILVPVTARPLNAALSMVTLLVVAAAGVVCISMPDIFDVGIPLAGSFPDGSYLTEYLDVALPRHFDGMVESLALVVKEVDFADTSIQDRLLALQEDFSAADRVSDVKFFLQPLRAWESCTAEGGATSSMEFASRVRAFLQAASFRDCGPSAAVITPSEFGRDVAWSSDGLRLQVVSMHTSMLIHTGVQERIDFMRNLRDRFNNHGLPGFPFAYSFLFSSRDARLWELIGSTLIYAGIAVVATAAIFNHPLGTVLIALCVVVVDFSLFAWMAAWGVPIDAVSFICLAIAAGLSVDYVVHQAHAIFAGGIPKSKGDIPVLVGQAIDTTGTSILKGALSTLLGVMVLSVAPTMVFRLFFKMLFGIVVFGVLGGFVLFPAALTLCLHAYSFSH